MRHEIGIAPADRCSYEFFKKKFAEQAGSYENAVANRQAIYLGGAAAAELFADVLLTPWSVALEFCQRAWVDL